MQITSLTFNKATKPAYFRLNDIQTLAKNEVEATSEEVCIEASASVFGGFKARSLVGRLFDVTIERPSERQSTFIISFIEDWASLKSSTEAV